MFVKLKFFSFFCFQNVFKRPDHYIVHRQKPVSYSLLEEDEEFLQHLIALHEPKQTSQLSVKATAPPVQTNDVVASAEDAVDVEMTESEPNTTKPSTSTSMLVDTKATVLTRPSPSPGSSSSSTQSSPGAPLSSLSTHLHLEHAAEQSLSERLSSVIETSIDVLENAWFERFNLSSRFLLQIYIFLFFYFLIFIFFLIKGQRMLLLV